MYDEWVITSVIVLSTSSIYLQIGSAHIYWILDLEGEVHSIWDL